MLPFQSVIKMFAWARAICAYTQMFQEGHLEGVDEEGRQYLSRVRDRAATLEQLIDDLLQISRLSRATEPLSDIDVGVVVGDAVDGLGLEPGEGGLRLEIQQTLPVVLGNRLHLARLFSALLSNARKYASETSPVIEIGCDESGDAFSFFVRDNGIGIAEEYHEKIFELFQRLDPRREVDGSGAGLAIAKRVVEDHGGRIWVESAPGEGSTFRFTIPKTRPEADEPRSA